MQSVASAVQPACAEVEKFGYSAATSFATFTTGTPAALSNATAGTSGNFAAQSLIINNVTPTPIVPVVPLAHATPAQGTSQTVINQPLHLHGDVYPGEDLAPQELKERVKKVMDEWYQQKCKRNYIEYGSGDIEFA